MDSVTAYTCFAFDQIFVTLDGRVMPCCLANYPLGTTDADFSRMLERKVQCNSDIFNHNDASLCWEECHSRVQTTARPDPKVVRKVVFYTNTYCPLQCRYCSLAYASDAPEWEMDEGLADRGRSIRPGAHTGPVWMHRKSDGSLVQPVHVVANDNPRFLDLVEQMIPVAQSNHWWFEFSGGDSAYHPKFASVLERCLEVGISISYLTSGVIPAKTEDLVISGVKAGLVWPTVSPDARSGATWSLIKRRPARLFDRILNFVRRCTSVERVPQLSVKFIVMRENLGELAGFVPFYRDLGVRKFVLSSCRRQPVHFVPPVTHAELRNALGTTLQVWAAQPLPSEAQLQLIGFEEFCPQAFFSAVDQVKNIIQKLKQSDAPTRIAPIRPGIKTSKATDSLPVLAEQALARAERLYNSGQLASAREAIQEALVHAPHAIQLHVCLGNIHFQMEEYVQARESFHTALELEPGNVDVLVRQAATALRCDQVELFERSLGVALALDQNNPEALRLLADTNFSSERFEDSLQGYGTLLQKNPEDVELLLLAGICQYRLGDLDLAQRSFEKVLAQEPDNRTAADNLKVVLHEASLKRN